MRLTVRAKELQRGDVLLATSRVVRAVSRPLAPQWRGGPSRVVVELYGEAYTRSWNARTTIAVHRDRDHAERVAGALAQFDGYAHTALRYFDAHAVANTLSVSSNLDSVARLARLVVSLAREVHARHSGEAVLPGQPASPYNHAHVIRP